MSQTVSSELNPILGTTIPITPGAQEEIGTQV